MAGKLKPEHVGTEIQITLLEYNTGHPSYSPPSILCDGLSENGRFILDTYHGYESQYGIAYFTFGVSQNCNMWALGHHFSDAGGTTPKPVNLFKLNHVGAYDLIGEYKTHDTGWYVLFRGLKAGTYKVMAIRDRASEYVRDYVSFDELYAEKENNTHILYLSGENAIYGIQATK